MAWVSEQQLTQAPVLQSNCTYHAAGRETVVPSVNIFARTFQSNGAAAGGEIRVDAGSAANAHPRVAAAADGSFLIAWSAMDTTAPTNGWDVYARPFSSSGVGGSVLWLNTTIAGNQYAPRLAAIGSDYLAVWTSWGQDGSREGVYGQFVHSNGSLVGGEFRVNTTTIGQQMQPVVASDGVSQFVAVWTSYTGVPNSFDLFAQRYLNVSAILVAMSAPYVWAPFVISNGVYQPQLVVTWAPVLGLSIADYEVYVNGAVGGGGHDDQNHWTMTAANGLTDNSTNSFTVDYVTTDGRRSPMSPAATGGTWSGWNWGGFRSSG